MSTNTNHSEFDRELLSAYVDGELSAVERVAVEAHLASDPAAQQQVAEFRRLSGLIQSLPRPTLPADFSEKVLQRSERGSSSPQVEPLQRSISVGRTWRGWAWAGAALAAALLVSLWLPNQPREIVRNDAPASGPIAKEFRELHAVPAPAGQVAGEEMSNSSSAVTRGQVEEFSPRSDAEGKFSISDSTRADEDASKANADNSRLLVVRVSMPQQALERRALDRVLMSNGIHVQSSDKEVATRELDVAGDVSDDRAPNGLASLELSEDSLAAGRGRDAEPVEVVLVEAPLEQITETLSTLQGDSENFYAVQIEEDSPLLGQKQHALHKSLRHLQRYSRVAIADRVEGARERGVTDGAVDESSPLPVVPDEAPQSEIASGRARAGDRAEEAASRAGESSELERKLLGKGRAFRYHAPVDALEFKFDRFSLENRKSEQLAEELPRYSGGGVGGELGRQSGDPTLRVLFVLQGLPAIASPAEVEPAEPAAPPR